MSDIDRMAMVMGLLGRKIPQEIAGLAADAVHPFAQLGNWPPNRRAQREASRISRRVATAIGRYAHAVPVEDLKGWTRWAFSEYARIAAPNSEAARVFTDAANRLELRERESQEAIRRGMENARAATTEQLVQVIRDPQQQAKWPPLLHPNYRHLLIPLDEDVASDGTRVVVCHAMVTCVDKRVEDVDGLRLAASEFNSWPASTPHEVWSEEEDRKYPPSGTWEEALRLSEAPLSALRRSWS